MDWNGDGKKDLIVGDSSSTSSAPRGGRIYIFINTGTDASPVFAAATIFSVGGSEWIQDYNQAMPFPIDWDNDGDNDMLSGERNGKVYYFENTGNNASPVFNTQVNIQSGGSNLDAGINSSPFVCDWDADGAKDLIVGSGAGAVRFYRNTGTDAAPAFNGYTSVSAGGSTVSGTGYTRPVVRDYNMDGFVDLLVGDENGTVTLYRGLDPSLPYIMHTATQVDAGDGLVDPGESIDVSCTISNMAGGATGVQVTLSTTSALCTVTQPNWSAGNLASDAAADNSASPYTLDVAPGAPLGAALPLQLDISANGGSYTATRYFSVQVSEPVLSVASALVNDSSGNTNLALNAGERAHITVILTNAGAAASSVTATLSCSSPNVAVVSATSGMGNIAKLGSGDNAGAPFCVQVDSNAWENGVYDFTLSLTYNGGDSDILSFQVGSDYGTPTVGPSSWVSTAGGTDHTAGLGDGYEWINIGFNFPFYGNEYNSSVLLGRHGYICLAPPWYISSGNQSIPSGASINCFVAPYWDNLDLGTGFVRSKVVGSSPNRIFVMEWNGLSRTGDSGSSVTFQALLYESGRIEFQYGPCSGGVAPNGASATIGIENTDGTGGIQHSYNQAAAVSDGTLIVFDRDAPPADADGDGVPDALEIGYWGTTTPTPGGDSDGDGQSNIDEINSSTDPSDINSVLRIEGTTVEAGADRIVSWQSVPGQPYYIFGCTDLSGSWSNLTPAAEIGSVSGNNACTVTVDSVEAKYFFLVTVP